MQYKVTVTTKEGIPVKPMGFDRWMPETLDDAMELIKVLEKLCRSCVIKLTVF